MNEELERLRLLFGAFRDGSLGGAAEGAPGHVTAALGEARARLLDRFDRVQLEETLRVCKQASSLSEAGRLLFAASRAQKRSANDADRLRKYLARFDLTFAEAHGR